MLHVYPSLHVSEFTSPSSTFICHLAFVHPPGPQVPGTPEGSAGPSVKLFWYVKTLLNGVGSFGIHWEGVKGPHYTEFFSHRLNRLPENYRTPGVSSSYPMVWHSTFWVFLVQIRGHFKLVCWKKGFFGSRNMCRRQCGNKHHEPTFHLDQVFAYFWISELFWHGIWSAPEYG